MRPHSKSKTGGGELALHSWNESGRTTEKWTVARLLSNLPQSVGTSVSQFHWPGRLPSGIPKNISWIALVIALEARRATEDDAIAAHLVRPGPVTYIAP